MQGVHSHIHVRGSVRTADGWKARSKLSAAYPKQLCDEWAVLIARACLRLLNTAEGQRPLGIQQKRRHKLEQHLAADAKVFAVLDLATKGARTIANPIPEKPVFKLQPSPESERTLAPESAARAVAPEDDQCPSGPPDSQLEPSSRKQIGPAGGLTASAGTLMKAQMTFFAHRNKLVS